jgi:hypothetical protein
LCCVVLCCVVLCCVVLCCVVLCCVVLSCLVSSCLVFCCVVLSSAVLSCAVLHCAQVLSLTKDDLLFKVSKAALKMKWVLARRAPHLHRRNERSGTRQVRHTRDGSDIETDR